jgi:hypothetical protein
VEKKEFSYIVYNSQDMEWSLVPIDEWMDKENVVCLQNGMLFNCKEVWNLVMCRKKRGWN